MDVKPKAQGDGKRACPNCLVVFSSLKTVHGHQRIHKTTTDNDSPLPPPPKNPYDYDLAFVFPGEKSEEEEEEEEEEGEITSGGDDDDSQDDSSPEARKIKMEDFNPDQFEIAATLVGFQYEFDSRVGVCSSSDSNDPQENPKRKVKAKVDPQPPKQENGAGSSSVDGDVGRVFKCNRCHKRFRSQQALGGHMDGHKNTDRMAEAMAGGETSSTSQIVKEHKCQLCGATFDSGQALGGHMRKHRVFNNPKEDVDGTTDVVEKKEAVDNVIVEDIHERNDSHKRMLLMLDLNQEPVDIDD